jgi:hypothetical protein
MGEGVSEEPQKFSVPRKHKNSKTLATRVTLRYNMFGNYLPIAQAHKRFAPDKEQNLLRYVTLCYIMLCDHL